LAHCPPQCFPSLLPSLRPAAALTPHAVPLAVKQQRKEGQDLPCCLGSPGTCPTGLIVNVALSSPCPVLFALVSHNENPLSLFHSSKRRACCMMYVVYVCGGVYLYVCVRMRVLCCVCVCVCVCKPSVIILPSMGWASLNLGEETSSVRLSEAK
jgi:hypothetical protein